LKNPVEYLAEETERSRYRIGVLFLFIALAFGAVQVYSCRYQLTPDGMDYLDIAHEIAARNWSAVANGYWGTLYSVLLAPIFLLPISAASELPVVHSFGLLMLVVSFLCFRFFLQSCLDALSESAAFSPDASQTPIPAPALSILGYVLFLWSALIIVPVKEIGPDVLVSAAIYLAAGMLLRLQRKSSVSKYLVFGAVLGIGYWAKAVMFPVGFIFLCVLMLKIRRWKPVVLSAVAFSIVAAPLVAALSFPRNRFTFGDSGVLNYATFVSPGGRNINWQGDPPGSGIPKHATRKITTRPAVYEFNGPIGGTYPPSYDPSYWNEGHQSTFNLRAQMAIVAAHLPQVIELLLVAQPSLIAVLLFFFFWGPYSYPDALRRWWHLLALCGAIIGLYMLVHLEGRFIGACVVLIWFSLFCATRIPADKKSRGIASAAVFGTVAAMLLSFSSDAAKACLRGCTDSARTHIEVAQGLKLPIGTPVAVIGAGNFSYWAHLSRVRIVAEIMQMDEGDFWSLAAPEQQRFFAAFRSTGAQWLIAQPPRVLVPSLAETWEPIGATSYYRYSLSATHEPRSSAARR